MVGFTLMHIYPFFAIVGILCSFLLIVWSLPGVVYLIVHRRDISRIDIAMLVVSLIVTAVIVVPDDFFVTAK